MPRANRVATIPGADDADLRMTSCAFGCIDLPRAISYIHRCHVRSPPLPTDSARVRSTSYQRRPNHIYSSARYGARARADAIATAFGGSFSGCTNKLLDPCYGFWCGTALSILGAGNFLDAHALGAFLARCQVKFGVIGGAPGEHPDPYHQLAYHTQLQQ
ncbi:hypothetical protein V8E53_002301 [Lactarius tabidus]